jgi:ABC-type ATPase with predicted acetyltransferase domain
MAEFYAAIPRLSTTPPRGRNRMCCLCLEDSWRILMQISVQHAFLPKTSSVRSSLVMDHFGIAFEQGSHTIAENLDLPIRPGQVVLFTGASGSGKSSLMRAASEQLASENARLINIDSLDLGRRTLIDSLAGDPAADMQLLAQCGLGEARLLLRTPDELSDGQRYRFRLALGVSQKPQWIIADEFTATLDRVLARVIAFNIRRIADATGIGFLLATTHEDVAEDLQADVHVRCRIDGKISVEPEPSTVPEADGDSKRKKKESASPTGCGSVRRPGATGRISLGGITAATTSG